MVFIVVASMEWLTNADTSNLLLNFLAKGNKSGRRKRATGWLKQSKAARLGIEYDKDGNNKNELTADENMRLVKIKREMNKVCQHYGNTWPHGITPMTNLRHAYNVCEPK